MTITRAFFFFSLAMVGCLIPEVVIAPCSVRCDDGDRCPEDSQCAADGYCHVEQPVMLCPSAGGGGAGRGYVARRCGFDMNRNGVVGECDNWQGGLAGCPDCHVCDGVTTDPDGDGVDEDLYYVDCDSAVSADSTSCGTPQQPCRTINYALNQRANGATLCQNGSSGGCEDIICFRGTCRDEPALGMGLGPKGSLASDPRCQNSDRFTRPRSGREVRDFSYPCNPTMLVGWDADGDGDYPPHDRDDTAVIDGAGKNIAFDGNLSGFATTALELAHFAARDFATTSSGGNARGFLEMGGSGSDPGHLVWVHDLELQGIGKNALCQDELALFELGQYGPSSEGPLAFENMSCLDCGGELVRARPLVAGPLRIEGLTFSVSIPTGGCRQAIDLGGAWQGLEVLDSVFDVKELAVAAQDGFMNFRLGIRDVVFINNKMQNSDLRINPCDGLPAATRSTSGFLIDRNLFRTVLPMDRARQNIRIEGSNDSVCFVEDVSITNNFFTTTVTEAGHGVEAAIWFGGGKGGAAPATLPFSVSNNSFYGPWTTTYQGPSAILTSNYTQSSQPMPPLIIKNNLFASANSGKPGDPRAIMITYAPSRLESDYNVFLPGAELVSSDGQVNDLAAWSQKNQSDAHSLSCTPNLVAPAEGDLHLQPSDSCARGRGTVLEPPLDIDSEPRRAPWDVGADQLP